jgi:dihydropteroate synthase
MLFKARQFRFDFPRPVLIMGIVNVTPDSFSDGGQFSNEEAAVHHALHLVKEGADIIDIGGESTRPRATPVSTEDELRRVLPVLEKLIQQSSAPISIDTMKPAVAKAALERGASVVNDVAAGRNNDEMFRIVAQFGAGYVCMHMQGSPLDMQRSPVYKDVVEDINTFFGERLSSLKASGVEAEQIVLDVGIGFGKTVEHNLRLLQDLRSFEKWERPILIGVSRKSFLEKLVGAELEGRLPASLASACWAVQKGVQIIRTHDVAATRQAVRMTELLVQKTEGKWKKPGN